ncbi:MAG: CotH kinase family protein [Candidatus Peregrinibacteria bacterium]|nr:CotH kinase family protein [Candidatus Peregrinibacteria bacterium]
MMPLVSLRFRRHYKLLVATLVLILGTIGLFGDMRVIAYTVSADIYAQDLEDAQLSSSIWNEEEEEEANPLFDEMFHEIKIDIDPEDFENMILTYQETEEKDYYPADITIDGVTVENAGIRLKGNSSLKATMEEEAMNFNVYYDRPFMIKFDEYVEDQSYLGYTQLALRSQFNDPTAMHEVLSYEIFEGLGVMASSSVYATVNVNGEEDNLYIITEVVNDDFLIDYLGDSEEALGDLYKASGGAKMQYKSDDPLDYNSYGLKTNENVSDMYDLVELFKFIDESSDEEFLESIDEYIDLESMIEYIAFCNVLGNLDSFAGNGNNYYIYQDPDTGQFLLIPWDLNEAFGRFGLQGSATGLDLYFENSVIEEGEGNPPQFQPFQNREEGAEVPEEAEAVEAGQSIDEDGAQLISADLIGPRPFGAAPEGNGEGQDFFPPPGDKPFGGVEGQGFEPGRGGGMASQLEVLSPLIERIFAIDELNEQYLKAVENLIENEFSEEELFERIEEIQELLLEKNEEYGFWEDEELQQFESGIEEMKQFIVDRIEFLIEGLAGV